MKNMEQDINAAWHKIAMVWPLDTFISRNPLAGFEDLSFSNAVDVHDLFAATYKLDACRTAFAKINHFSIKWLQILLNPDISDKYLSCPTRGIYVAFKDIILHDKEIHKNAKQDLIFIKNLPDAAELTINFCMQLLQISSDKQQRVYFTLLNTLPGWSGYIKYLAQNKYMNEQWKLDIDYLAIRLMLTVLFMPNINEIKELFFDIESIVKPQRSDYVNELYSNEKIYQQHIFEQLKNNFEIIERKADAQFVFCIDPRSEPIRRNLEEFGNYKTYGFAGFFGLPIAIKDYVTRNIIPSCPFILKPKHVVRQVLEKGNAKNFILKMISFMSDFFAYLKSDRIALFNSSIFMPVISIYYLIVMLIRSIVPNWIIKLFYRLTNNFSIQKNITYDLAYKDDDPFTLNFGIPIDAQVQYAANFLLHTGIAKEFSKIIILCGHGGHTTNNQFHSALDCGACGGRNGVDNAHVMTNILNNENIRSKLSKIGVSIPQDTIFVYAEHNTTVDEINLYEANAISKTSLILEIKAHLKQIQQQVLKEYKPLVEKSFYKSFDWSETRPELGANNNACFIIGPRMLSTNINLHGRSFLHSYDFHYDKDAKVLGALLNSTLLVSQSMNHQYLFSAKDNQYYGSGNKVLHNATCGVGVMSGVSSDLLYGIPLQSISTVDNHICHEQLRLLIIIYSTRDIVLRIIQNSYKLSGLFANDWNYLAVIEPGSHDIYLLQNDFSWLKQ